MLKAYIRSPECPELQVWEAFESGEKDPFIDVEFLSHLDQCAHCQDHLAQINARSDSVVMLSYAKPTPFDQEPECEQLRQFALSLSTTKTDLKGTSPFRLGQYDLGESLGRGGQGSVYKALHRTLGIPVVVKILHDNYHNQDEAVRRFHREMKTMASVKHDNIVHIRDACIEAPIPYLVMEFVEGLSVDKVIQNLESGRLSVADCCQIIMQSARGLAHVHQMEIVHRDVKPSNLLLSNTGVVKLLDWGLVRYQRGSEDLSEVSRTGLNVGTDGYASPEQRADSRTVGPKSDIYSLGATFFRLLTGQSPRLLNSVAVAQTPLEQEPPDTLTMEQLIACDNLDAGFRVRPASLQSLCADIPPEIVTFLGQMLDTSPANRPTGEEVVNFLQNWHEGSDPLSLLDHVRQTKLASAEIETPVGQREQTQPNHGTEQPKRLTLTGWLSLVLLGVVLVGTGGFGAVLALQWNPAAKTEPAPVPGQWFSVLTKHPVELVLVDPRAISLTSFDPKRRMFGVQNAVQSIWGVYDTPRLGYRFRVEIRQQNWKGGAGIVLGFGERPTNLWSDASFGRRYQVFQIYNHEDAKPGKQWRLERQLREYNSGFTSPYHDNRFGLASAMIPEPAESCLLEVTVGAQRVVDVSLNGVKYPLIVQLANKFPQLQSSDQIGYIGLYSDSADVVFSNAEMSINNED